MKSFAEVFDKVLEYIHQKVLNNELTKVAYDMWLKSMIPDRLDGNVAYIKVQSSFQKEIILKNYSELLKEAFMHVMGFEVEIVIVPDEHSDENDYKPIKDREELELTFSNAEYDYTFDTFIVGRSNEFAHAACVAVSKNRGGAYNPLFIHGPSGLGKLTCSQPYPTLSRLPNLIQISCMLQARVFTNELISAIKEKDTLPFRKSTAVRTCFLLMISSSFRARSQLRRNFPYLQRASFPGQADSPHLRPPTKDIKTLEERIRTRFEWGLIADITTPDFETRVAIIKRKADLLNLKLSDDVVDCIATRLKTNIRQLEGCVKKLKAYQHLVGTPPTMTQAQNAIREILSDDSPAPVTVDRIISDVAAVYGVTADDIRSMKRSSQISTARIVAAYVIKEMTQLSLESIGAELGGKNHSTASYYIKSAVKSMESDPRTKETIDDIIKNLRESS